MLTSRAVAAAAAAFTALVVAAGCAGAQAVRATVTYVDDSTLRGERNFLTGYDTANGDGTYNLVVEIPTGTSEKWEICKAASLAQPGAFPGCTAPGREIVHEVRDGTRRVVAHIGYPGNYGALPKTLAGDGDPLDVIAVGPAAERGSVIPIKVVGVIKCLDGGEQDDKVVAITAGSPLYARVSTGADLERVAPGAADLVYRWFLSYKPAGTMVCEPMQDEAVAASIIDAARDAFAR